MDVRVCALKRGQVAAAQARRRIKRVARRKGYELHPDTVEAAGYVFVGTNAPALGLSAGQSLESTAAAGRWNSPKHHGKETGREPICPMQ